jgi:hypothetical protein
MDPGHRNTQAENTAAMLHQSVHDGVPVLIPGAWERRADRPVAHATSAGPRRVEPVFFDRERLEREGGGAPAERKRQPRRTILARLWHAVLHASNPFAIWHRRLPATVNT